MRVTPDAVVRPVRRQKKAFARLPLPPPPPPRRRSRGQHQHRYHHHQPVYGEEDEDDDDNALEQQPLRTRRRRRLRPATEIVAAASAAAETVTAAPALALEASPRLWALLREAQEGMERGTDVLGDELDILWRNVREGATDCGRETEDMVAAGAAAAVGGGGGGGDGSGSGGRGKGQRLPRREADALLDGLEALQAEMEAEASSFQRQKTELMRKLKALPIGGRRDGNGQAGLGDVRGRPRRGKQDSAAGMVMELEEEAESMRTAVIASHARLLGRVREVC